jgi:hypothetical protein
VRLRAALVPFVAVLASALVPGAAHAAVPSKAPKSTRPCPDGPGSARLWQTVSKGKVTKLAVDNPCNQFLQIASAGEYYNGAAREVLWVAPHTHFNWGKARIAAETNFGSPVGINSGGWIPVEECQGPTTVRIIWKYNDVRYAQDENGENC